MGARRQSQAQWLTISIQPYLARLRKGLDDARIKSSRQALRQLAVEGGKVSPRPKTGKRSYQLIGLRRLNEGPDFA